MRVPHTPGLRVGILVGRRQRSKKNNPKQGPNKRPENVTKAGRAGAETPNASLTKSPDKEATMATTKGSGFPCCKQAVQFYHTISLAFRYLQRTTSRFPPRFASVSVGRSPPVAQASACVPGMSGTVLPSATTYWRVPHPRFVERFAVARIRCGFSAGAPHAGFACGGFGQDEGRKPPSSRGACEISRRCSL
jgi:hypothetical protein